MTLLVVGIAYMGILIAIGVISSRAGAASAEDYFLAGRSFGTLVLFMALFGTNVTAFALLGLPGKAYHQGVGVFGFFGASAAFWGPIVFILIGYPIWKFGRQYGYVTPSQMFADRWASPMVGKLVLILMLLYTVPYVVIGIMGGGIAINKLSEDAVSYELAAGVLTSVTVFYTGAGGMRGTAWTNVFQASVFLVFLIVVCVGIASKLGGAAHLHERLVAERPDLLSAHNFPPGKWATGFLVGPVSIIAFPHMFMRLLAARDASSLRRTIKIYPLALVMLFLPVTLIGVWGALVVPGLEGKASDEILPILVAEYLPTWLSAIGLAAILAAVMSSLDGQLLTISTLLSIDVFHRAGDARRWGRVSVVVIAGVAFLVALARPEAIFSISVYAFSGYTLMIPVMLAAFYWRQSTAAGIVAGLIVGHVMLALYYLPSAWNPLASSLPDFGVFPVAVCLVVEIILIILISFATSTDAEQATKFEKPLSHKLQFTQ